MVEEALQSNSPQKKPTQQTAVGKDSVTYRVRTKEVGWLPEVTDLEDYAGYGKQSITDVAIRVKNGFVRYRVHVKGGGWLPYVTGYDVMDFDNGYAGIGKPIDLLEVQYTPPKGQEGKGVLYRVSPSNAPALYYDWQRNNDRDKGQDGYAGLLGHSVARLQMYVE